MKRSEGSLGLLNKGVGKEKVEKGEVRRIGLKKMIPSSIIIPA